MTRIRAFESAAVKGVHKSMILVLLVSMMKLLSIHILRMLNIDVQIDSSPVLHRLGYIYKQFGFVRPIAFEFVCFDIFFVFHLDFYVFFEVCECSAEWAGECRVVCFKEWADAFVMESMGTWCDEEGLADGNAE